MELIIIINVIDDMNCMFEEMFGLLVFVVIFKIVEEVVEWVNNSFYGLVVYVFIENIKEVMFVFEELEYGIVGVNDGFLFVV